MAVNPQVIIIGGGLAGLAGAIHLSKKGLTVTVLEKSSYPKHKVCGEYISNEVLPYFTWLGIDVGRLNPLKINTFTFSSANGKAVTTKLPLGGFGISRYTLDDFLYKKALSNGCKVFEANVTGVDFKDDAFTVTASGKEYHSKIVISAYGRRSNIDQVLSRNFFYKKSPWLAVKAHYKGNFPDNTVALHNFKGGYCGVSKVENDTINICYLADYKTFKKYKNTGEYQTAVLSKNSHLKDIFDNCKMIFDKPLTISQVSFDKKPVVENHMLMTGDTAGLIHPLCGNGMAMAVHSAKIAAELVLGYYSGKINSRENLEKEYEEQWKKQFASRLHMGRVLGKLLEHKWLTARLHALINIFPVLLPHIIKQTHGKPIAVN